MEEFEKLQSAARFLTKKFPKQPDLAVVLGSGLGKFGEFLKNQTSILFSEIPNFLPTSVDGHTGKLTVGNVSTKLVAVFAGRLHFYEGHSLNQVVFPVRTMATWGIKQVLLTNASGGINPSFRPQDLMLITDHINFTGTNPLIGPNLEKLGPRFPDLSDAYHRQGQKIIKDAARLLKIDLREGVYAGCSGPSYETPAEIRLFRSLGADAVGMSTVPEVIAANHAGLKVNAIACITNLAADLSQTKLTHTEVVENANATAEKLFSLLLEAIPRL